MEQTNQLEFLSSCKVCGDVTFDRFDVCDACQQFLYFYVQAKLTHDPCLNDKQCIITKSTRTKCTCCRLKKCLSLGMDPYDSIRQMTNYTKYASSESIPSSDPFYPCPTCFQTSSDQVSDDRTPLSSNQIGTLQQECRVCGTILEGGGYKFECCYCCIIFFESYISTKQTHDPCRNNQQCFVTETSRLKCTCCFLKRCLAAAENFPFAIDQGLSIRNESKERPIVRKCKTCDSSGTVQATAISTRDPTSQKCKVCGAEAKGKNFGVITCRGCSRFLGKFVRIKQTHVPCFKNQRCAISETSRFECPCCYLKKCLAAGMSSRSIQPTNKCLIIKNEPKEWSLLRPCRTCDSSVIQAVNDSIEDLKSFCLRLKGSSTKH